MTDHEHDMMDEEMIVVMNDEDGNEFYYREEMIIPVGDKRFAILVAIDEEGGCNCGGHDDEDEEDVFIARIDTDEDGEDVYVDPSDEEFEEVRKAYEELTEDDEEE